MRKLLIAASLVAMTVPGLAMAQTCHEEKNDNRVVGTVVGAGVGALIGGAIGRGPGAVAGAVGGGVVGNVAGGNSVHCDRTGYYDSNGAWHQSDGYYDGDGHWVANVPANGYYDSYGRWVPTAPTGDGADVSFTGRRGDIDARADWLSQKIQTGLDRGDLTREDADQDFDDLNRIRNREARLRADHDGLTDDDRADLNSRLDDLSNSIGR
jgi:hypothetical protein